MSKSKKQNDKMMEADRIDRQIGSFKAQAQSPVEGSCCSLTNKAAFTCQYQCGFLFFIWVGSSHFSDFQLNEDSHL